MYTKQTVQVYCTLQVEGTHNWPGCPFDEVDYLRVPHRHVFHIKAYASVQHNDRDQEFIMLKHKIEDYLFREYYDMRKKLHVFGSMSCEMIAEKLCTKFDLDMCDVSEDNENGAIIRYERDERTI